MEAKNAAGQQHFPGTCKRCHGREHYAVTDDELRIPLKAPVRYRHDVEQFLAEQVVALLIPAHTRGQHVDQLPRTRVAQPTADGRRHVIQDRLQQPVTCALHGQRLHQQLARFQHFNAECSEQPHEAVMLFARPLTEENVVEQELVHHGRHHVIHFRTRRVHQHALQPPDFGPDVQHRNGS
jgi:hypothetical protein